MSVSAEPPSIERRLAAFSDAAREEVAMALGMVAEAVAAEARRSLGRSAPSRPGEPPADPKGRIAAALGTTVDERALAAKVVVGAPQARLLEYGTRRMAARPILRPAVAAMAAEMRERMKDAFARAIRNQGERS